jgi:hypothetical protein
MIEQGALYAVVCKECLDYIRAYNVNAGMTTGQIVQMKNDFATIKGFLDDGQPWGAKAAIEAISDEGYSSIRGALLTILSKVA